MKWYKSYKFKSLISIFTIMLLLVSIVFSLVIDKVKRDIETQVYDKNMDAAIMLVDAMDLYFAELKGSMEIIAHADEVQNYEFERTNRYMQMIVDHNESISQMYLIDTKGMQYYKTSHLETLGPRAEREYFQRALSGEAFISDAVISKSTGKPITVIAVPIYTEDTVKGVLGASIDLEQISRFISTYNFEQEGYAYVVDHQGRVISHPNDEFVKDMLDLSYLEPVEVVIDGGNGIGKYTFLEEEKLVAYVNMEETRWGVLVQVPVEVAFRSINQIEKWLVSLLAVVIVGIIIASNALTKYFMKPINEIVHVIESVQDDRDDIYNHSPRDDEYGLIHNAFADLMHDLNILYDSLEDQVEERTNQVTAINKELILSNARLKSTIQELEETQEKLIHSEKISASTRIGVRLSHEINTPLGIGITTISYFQQQLKSILSDIEKGNATVEKLNDFMEIAQDSAQTLEHQLHKAAQIVSYLKELQFKFQSYEKSEIGVHEEITKAIENLRVKIQGYNYELDIKCSEDIIFWGWKGVLEEVFYEILDNSFKHGYKAENHFIIHIEVEEDADYIYIRYDDNGPGIDKEEMRYVFEPFYKGKMTGRGVGMGLTKIYQIVTGVLEGEISFEESRHAGVNLMVKLPKGESIS